MSGNWAFRILDPVSASALSVWEGSQDWEPTSSRSEAQGDPAVPLTRLSDLLLDLFAPWLHDFLWHLCMSQRLNEEKGD